MTSFLSQELEQDLLGIIQSIHDQDQPQDPDPASGVALSAEQQERLQSFLERCLVDRGLLSKYLLWVQRAPKTAFRRDTTLSEASTSALLERGVGMLHGDDLLKLALSPMALRRVFYKITDEVPDYWRERILAWKTQHSDLSDVFEESETRSGKKTFIEPTVTQADDLEALPAAPDLSAAGKEWKFLLPINLPDEASGKGGVRLRWQGDESRLNVLLGGLLARQFDSLDITWRDATGGKRASAHLTTSLSDQEENQPSPEPIRLVPSDHQAPRGNDVLHLRWQSTFIDSNLDLMNVDVEVDLPLAMGVGADEPTLVEPRVRVGQKRKTS